VTTGRRRTRQRAAVEDLLAHTREFRTAQQIHTQLREAGTGVGLTTVYRCLAAMAESGDVDVLLSDDGEARYRACSEGHHHHLVCRSCGRTVEVTAAPVERWSRHTAEQHGFTDVTHTVEIIGLCPDCGGQ
jgi:Fur family ferric uptake transcriptional regulator